MSTKPKPVMSDEDFERWEPQFLQTLADLITRYTNYDARVVKATRNAKQRERAEA